MLFFSFFSSYLIASAVTFFLDVNYPDIREKHPLKKPPPDHTGEVTMEYSKLLRTGVVNCIMAMPAFWNYEYFTSELENDHSFIYNFVVWMMITDIVFYTVHRILHLPRFYKYHKLHHTYKYTYGPSAIYASPLEFVLGNIGPNFVSFTLLRLSHWEMTVIIVFQTFYTVIVSHGGYKFASGGHLQHHLTKKEPYGLLLTDKVVSLITQ